MAYCLMFYPKFQALDSSGNPLVSGLLFTYEVGGTTKKTTYKTVSGTANDNPIVLDARGEAMVYLDGDTKFVLAPATDTDPPTAPIWTIPLVHGFSAFALTLLDDANAAAVLTTLGVSAFAQTLLDDATASAFMTTLGFSTLGKSLIDDTTMGAFLTTLGISAPVQTILDDASIAAVRATLQIGNSAGFSSPDAGMPYRSDDDTLAFVPGRVPLILAADEMYLIMPASITKDVTCAANTIYYAYVAQPASGLTIAAGDITVNTTPPTIKPAQGNRFMDATGVLQFLGTWFTDATSDFCTGVRAPTGYAILTEIPTGVTLGTAWGDVVIPGCPLIAGTMVRAGMTLESANYMHVAIKGTTNDDYEENLSRTDTYQRIPSPIYTDGDGKIAAYVATAAKNLALWQWLEPR